MGGGGRAGKAANEPAGSEDPMGIPKVQTHRKGQPPGQIHSQWSPIHLAADGCSILDLVIPLEKTSSITCCQSVSQFARNAQTSPGHATKNNTAKTLSNIWKGGGTQLFACFIFN